MAQHSEAGEVGNVNRHRQHAGMTTFWVLAAAKYRPDVVVGAADILLRDERPRARIRLLLESFKASSRAMRTQCSAVHRGEA